LKRYLLATLVALTSAPALAQTPDTTSTPSAPAAQSPSAGAPASGTSPLGPPEPPASPTGADTPTAAPPPAEAPKPSSWTDRVRLSSQAFLRYSYELGEEARGANQFQLDRLHLQAEFLATDRVRFQVTLDAGDTRNSAGNQVFFAQTKNAFVEVKDLIAKGLYLRAGIVPLAWIPYEDEVWGYRVQGPTTLDRWGYLTSADFGLAFGGPLPSKYGSFQVNVNNGEGFKFIEPGKRKELQSRLTLKPLAARGGVPAGLFITGYGSYGRYDDAHLPARERTRVIGQVGLQSTPLTLAASYVVARDANAKVGNRYTVSTENLVRGEGLYAFAVLNVGALIPAAERVDLFGRYDSLDPDTEAENNNVHLFFAGLAYKWTPAIKSLVNYEGVSYGADVGGPGTNRPDERRIKLQTEFRL
jgi:hypothetical protein